MGLTDFAASSIAQVLGEKTEELELRKTLLTEVKTIRAEAHEREIEAVHGDLGNFKPLDYMGNTYEENRDRLELLSEEEREELHNFYDRVLKSEDPLSEDIRREDDPVAYRYAALKDEAWELEMLLEQNTYDDFSDYLRSMMKGKYSDLRWKFKRKF